MDPSRQRPARPERTNNTSENDLVFAVLDALTMSQGEKNPMKRARRIAQLLSLKFRIEKNG